MPINNLYRQNGFGEASCYLWRSRFGGMSVPDAKRFKDLKAENTRLKRLLAQQVFETEVIKGALRESGGRAGAQDPVRSMVKEGLSERRALAAARMGASAFRCDSKPDHNVELREEIAALAHRHRRCAVERSI